jgi:hypothetical protein
MTTILACSRMPRYNKLKEHALEIFNSYGGWISPPDWALLARFYPVRSAYSYLKRLHHFGLLERDTSSGRRLYRISAKGGKRLLWLRSQRFASTGAAEQNRAQTS